MLRSRLNLLSGGFWSGLIDRVEGLSDLALRYDYRYKHKKKKKTLKLFAYKAVGFQILLLIIYNLFLIIFLKKN